VSVSQSSTGTRRLKIWKDDVLGVGRVRKHEQGKKFYHSPAYRAAFRGRENATEFTVILLRGT